VLWGSISLAQSFMQEGLIDEYQLVVCSVVLGRGKPPFRDTGASLDLKLLKTKPFDRGTVLLTNAAAKNAIPRN